MQSGTTDLDEGNLHTNGGYSELNINKWINRNNAAASGSMSVCSLCFFGTNFFFPKQAPVQSKVPSTSATTGCNPASMPLQGSLDPFCYIITEVSGFLGFSLGNRCGFRDWSVGNTLRTIWGSSSRASSDYLGSSRLRGRDWNGSLTLSCGDYSSQLSAGSSWISKQAVDMRRRHEETCDGG